MALLAQVIIGRDNGLPEDAIVNTFHFALLAPPPTGWPDADILRVETAIQQAYAAVHAPGATALSAWYSKVVNQDNVRMKLYDLDEAPPRVPLRDVPFTFGPPGTSGMPGEVALCMSYQAAQESGFEQASRRGRIYFGPFSTAPLESPDNNDARPSAALIDTLRGVGTFLLSTFDGSNVRWVVYSQKFDTWAPVDNGWVDNAWDTQRRRGAAATTRATFT